MYYTPRLKVTIVREIAPDEQGILFFLMVNEDFTIEQLQLMVRMCMFQIGSTLITFLSLD